MAKRRIYKESFDLGYKCGVWGVFNELVSEYSEYPEYGENIIDELLPVAERFGLTEEDLKRALGCEGAPEDWLSGKRKENAGISEEESREDNDLIEGV